MIRQKIVEIAGSLGIDPSWLDNLIRFETGGTYNPKIENPNSSAKGLIQIIDSSAQGIGYADSLDAVTKNPDFDSQMNNVVYPYLNKYKPFPTKQSLYMAVFYPKYRNVNPYTMFPEYVRKINPGIVTVRDYINKVDNKSMVRDSVLLVSALIVTWFIIKRYSK